MKVLVIDVGGTSVKLMASEESNVRRIRSGRRFTAKALISQVKKRTRDWEYDVVSLGFPGPVLEGQPAAEPGNLGSGWVGFDYAKAFGKPTKIINDAALQALASYQGGRMLFLGLGTGLGSTLIVDDVVIPLELGELKYTRFTTIDDLLKKASRKRRGLKHWRRSVLEVVPILKYAFQADYVMIGGGGAKYLTALPDGARRGDNRNAFAGGCRLWERHRRVRTQTSTWTIR